MNISQISLTISKNQELAKALQNDQGKFKFGSIPSASLLSFKADENDQELEDFLQKEIPQRFLEMLQLLYQNLEPGRRNAPFTMFLSPKLAVGCDELFSKRLRPDIFSEEWHFFMKDYGKSFVLTLKQKNEGVEIPLIHLEEKTSLEKLEKATRQFSKYAKRIFSQQISFGERKLKFESAYILVLSQTGNQVKLLQYQRPSQDQTLAECVKHSEFDLYDIGTKNLSLNSVHDLFRVLFNCAFLQLKSLDLIH